MAPPRHFTKSTKMKLYFLLLLKFYSTIHSKLLEFMNRDCDQMIFCFANFEKKEKHLKMLQHFRKFLKFQNSSKLQKEIVFSRGKPGPLLQFLYLYPIIQGDHLNIALFLLYLGKSDLYSVMQ